jgi:hypothetical protein
VTRRAQKTRIKSNDAALVPYPEIRDRFLARMPDDDNAALLEQYVAIGRFVVDRWSAEELDRMDGEPLDEAACWDRWDQCSEKHLRDLRTEAKQLLDSQMREHRAGAFIRAWARRSEPMRGIIAGLSWFAKEAMRGFVAGVGLLLFGLMIAWLAPSITRAVRSAVDEALPHDTRPATDHAQPNR